MKKSNWQIKKLGEVCEVITKGTTPTTDGFKFLTEGVNFVKIESITPDGNFINSKFAHVSEECHSAFKRSQLKENDILYSIAGALGRVAIVNKDILPANTNQALAIIRLKKEVKLDFVFLTLALRTQNISEQIDKNKAGVAQLNLSLSQLSNFEIPVPEIEEQRRIVGVLDKVLGEADKEILNVEKNLANLKELWNSTLNHAFSHNSQHWTECELKSITSKIGSGSTPTGGQSSYKASGTSLIRSMNVRDDGFDMKGLAFIDDNQAKQLDSVSVAENDILFNITGASITRCCLVPKHILPARVNQHVLIIRISSKEISPKFLQMLLVSSEYKTKLLSDSRMKGSTKEALTKSYMESFKIKLPPLPEQKQIVAKLDKVSAEIKALEDIYSKKLSSLKELKQSILNQAFNGEL